MVRLERDRPSIRPSDKFSGREVLRSIRSPQVIVVFILFFFAGTGTFGLALFLPSIVSGLGFSRTKTQLLSVGPFAAGFLGACFRWAHPQNLPLMVLLGFSHGNIGVPIRPLPIEGYCNSFGCHLGGCRILDLSQ
jgi:hypothetical protein